ncbi:hypothetical protein [Aurantiacibacter spongiae]|uniref:Lipoprotein n=1 Tax=Aurantiacibacter spongiae TaxID=2488860 RepID=A0A3N5CPX2_9SPHN|nr:hypothetical protein [Aurantiacibacter spongiae]RPF70416.1 hypothetical protein EG799_01320 [Aurantiacibacter spongiae]
MDRLFRGLAVLLLVSSCARGAADEEEMTDQIYMDDQLDGGLTSHRVEPSSGPADEAPILHPINYDQFAPLLEAGTGCSFSSARGELLLVSTASPGAIEGAKGVVDAGNGPSIVRSLAGGGYEALRKGPTFSDGSVFSIEVVRGPGDGQPEEIESTVWPASLIVRVEKGGSVTYENGQWSCGA